MTRDQGVQTTQHLAREEQDLGKRILEEDERSDGASAGP